MTPDAAEKLTFGPPVAAEMTVLVDPRRAGTVFAMGTLNLLPGGALPMHRTLQHDAVLFVHKGQGRAVLADKRLTVVPGTVLVVPKGMWHSVRNTGTGLLQMTWTTAPEGLEEFFREFAKVNLSDAAAVQALGQRYGAEFRAESGAPDAVTAPGAARRRHRGRRGGKTAQKPAPPVASVPAAPAVPPAAPAQPHGHRRRRRGGRGRGGGSSARPAPAAPALSTPAPSPAAAARPRHQRQGRGSGRPRRGRVKEVYMDGRWVTISGEGPVIAPGRPTKPDDDAPSGPLTVPL